jgi:hypothetical protein
MLGRAAGSVALLAVVLAGCGGGGHSSSVPKATEVVTAPNPGTGKPRSTGRPELPPGAPKPPPVARPRVPPGSALARQLTRSARETGLRVCSAASPAQLAKALHARAPTLRAVADALAARYPPQFRQAAIDGCLAARPGR